MLRAASRLFIMIILCAVPIHIVFADQTLTTDGLQLTLSGNTNTFGMMVVNCQTGATVLQNKSISFGKANVTGVQSITRSTIDGNEALVAVLKLSDGKTATAQYVAVNSDRIDVQLVGQGSSVDQYFTDLGERYYGTFMKTYGRELDNRGLNKQFRGSYGDNDRGVVATEGSRAPFYFTDRNVGIYANTTALGSYSFGVNNATGFSFEGSTLNYSILGGANPKQIMQQHNQVATPAGMPPDWALSTIWWRNDYNNTSGSGVNTPRALVLQDADKLIENHIPASAIMIDRPYGTGGNGLSGWGNYDFASGFGDPSTHVTELKNRDMNLMVWIANRLANNQLNEAKNSGGDIQYFDGSGSTPAADMRDPDTYEWFRTKLETFGELGIVGYKIDRGGEGEMPASVNNANVQLFNKAAYESLARYADDQTFMFSRDVTDSSRKYTAVWNGDSDGNFDGLATSVRQGIRAGLTNFPIFGTDTGGYYDKPEKEVWCRWMGFSAYTPMMEILLGPGRTPWRDYDAQTLEITVQHARIHHDLIPYVRSHLYQNTLTGIPVIRAMFLEFPTDPQVQDRADQYMYGDNLLVAPVVKKGVSTWAVYLPAGTRWLEYNSKQSVYAGGQTVTAAAGLQTVPVFIRDGAIQPHGDIVEANQSNWISGWQPHLTLDIFPSDAVDGHFDYWTGTRLVEIFARLRNGQIHVSFDDLEVNGVIDLYLGRFFEFDGSVDAVRLGNLKLGAQSGYFYDPDLDLLRVSFAAGQSTDLWVDVVPVPEPVSLATLTMTALGLLRRRNRQ